MTEEEAWTVAMKVAAAYVVECEAYDVSVCTGGSFDDGTARPANSEEMDLINSNARRRWDQAAVQAHRAGIDPGLFPQALKHVERKGPTFAKVFLALPNPPPKPVRSVWDWVRSPAL